MPSSIFILGLLAKTATAARLLASHYNGQIYTLDLTSNGSLSIVSSMPSGATLPSWLEFDEGESVVYITDESWFGSGTLVYLALARDGTLTPTGATGTGGGEIHCSLYGGEDGNKFLAVANYEGSFVTTYTLPLTSTTQPGQKFSFTMDAPGPNPDRQNKPHPHSIIPNPAQTALLAPDLGADLIRIFSVSEDGELSECPSAETAPGDGPRHGEFANFDGMEYLYTVNELGNSVTAWSVGAGEDGCLVLTALQTLSTYGPSGTAPALTKAAEVHVRDTSVYVANRNDKTFGAESDSIAVFTADTTSGELVFEELADAHAWYPRTFVVSPGGEYLAVGGQTSATVAVLERDVTTGAIGGLVGSVQVGEKGNDGQEDGLSAVIWV